MEDFLYRRLFFQQFLVGRVNFFARELVYVEPLDDFPVFAVGTHGQGSYDSLRCSIAAVGANAHAEPLSVGSGVHESANSVNSSIRRARRARQAALRAYPRRRVQRRVP